MMFTPLATHDDLYPENTLYCGFPCPGQKNWLPQDQSVLDNFPSSSLLIAGETPLIVHPGMCDPDALSFLKPLSTRFAQNLIITERSKSALSCIFRDHLKQGGKIYASHRFPDEVLPPEVQPQDPELLSSLNNKSHLTLWAPEENCPARRKIFLDDLALEKNFPFVAKVFSAFTSGGGVDVHICRNPKDVEEAKIKFAGEKEIIVEEWIKDAKVFCVQGAIRKDGSILYLGSSEQQCSDDGLPLHNWVDPASEIGDEGQALAMKILNRASEAGYRGWAGIDILKNPEGALSVIDLNFRICYSTPGLLFYPSLQKQWNVPCWTVRGLVATATKKKLFECLEKSIQQQILLPRAIHHQGDFWRIAVLVGGSTREEVEYHCAELSESLNPKSS